MITLVVLLVNVLFFADLVLLLFLALLVEKLAAGSSAGSLLGEETVGISGARAGARNTAMSSSSDLVSSAKWALPASWLPALRSCYSMSL